MNSSASGQKLKLRVLPIVSSIWEPEKNIVRPLLISIDWKHPIRRHSLPRVHPATRQTSGSSIDFPTFSPREVVHTTPVWQGLTTCCGNLP